MYFLLESWTFKIAENPAIAEKNQLLELSAIAGFYCTWVSVSCLKINVTLLNVKFVCTKGSINLSIEVRKVSVDQRAAKVEVPKVRLNGRLNRGPPNSLLTWMPFNTIYFKPKSKFIFQSTFLMRCCEYCLIFLTIYFEIKGKVLFFTRAFVIWWESGVWLSIQDE